MLSLKEELSAFINNKHLILGLPSYKVDMRWLFDREQSGIEFFIHGMKFTINLGQAKNQLMKIDILAKDNYSSVMSIMNFLDSEIKTGPWEKVLKEKTLPLLNSRLKNFCDQFDKNTERLNQVQELRDAKIIKEWEVNFGT